MQQTYPKRIQEQARTRGKDEPLGVLSAVLDNETHKIMWDYEIKRIT